MRIRWFRQALLDLNQIEAYIAEDSPTTAVAIVLKIVNSIIHPNAPVSYLYVRLLINMNRVNCILLQFVIYCQKIKTDLTLEVARCQQP